MFEKTILCIEDDRDTAGLIELLLEDPALKTVSAFGGEEGLDMARRLRPDLILLDVYMRDMSGWEVYQRLRGDEAMRDIPIIVLSGYPRAVIAALGKDFGDAAGYVCKPFSPVELRGAVDQALGIGV